jgi:hypothetical protein
LWSSLFFSCGFLAILVIKTLNINFYSLCSFLIILTLNFWLGLDLPVCCVSFLRVAWYYCSIPYSHRCVHWTICCLICPPWIACLKSLTCSLCLSTHSTKACVLLLP